MRNKEGKVSVGFIVRMVLLALVLIFFVIAVFARKIFGDTAFANAIQINVGDLVNIGRIISENYPAILKSLTYVIVIFLLQKGIRLLIKVIFKNTVSTLKVLFDSLIRYAALMIAVWLVLRSFGVNTTTLLASAGILALIIGLAAQPLITDLLSGLSIIFEGEFKVGDIVTISGFRGTVIAIGLKAVSIQDAAGNIKIISNSDVRDTINMSDVSSLAVLDIAIDYSEPLERVERVFAENFDKIKESIPAILDGPYYKGVSDFSTHGVVLKIFASVEESKKFQTERDLKRAVKLLFDEHDIRIAIPQVAINQPKDYHKVTQSDKDMSSEFVEEQLEATKNIDIHNDHK